MSERIVKKDAYMKEIDGIVFDLRNEKQRDMYFRLAGDPEKVNVSFESGYAIFKVRLDKTAFEIGKTLSKDDAKGSWSKSKPNEKTGEQGPRISLTKRFSGTGFNGMISLSIDPIKGVDPMKSFI